MRTVVQLNQSDIKQVLANYFNVDICKVKLEIRTECEGIMEHKVNKIYAEVEKNETV